MLHKFINNNLSIGNAIYSCDENMNHRSSVDIGNKYVNPNYAQNSDASTFNPGTKMKSK